VEESQKCGEVINFFSRSLTHALNHWRLKVFFGCCTGFAAGIDTKSSCLRGAQPQAYRSGADASAAEVDILTNWLWLRLLLIGLQIRREMLILRRFSPLPSLPRTSFVHLLCHL